MAFFVLSCYMLLDYRLSDDGGNFSQLNNLCVWVLNRSICITRRSHSGY